MTMSGVTWRITIAADGFEGKSCGIFAGVALVRAFSMLESSLALVCLGFAPQMVVLVQCADYFNSARHE